VGGIIGFVPFLVSSLGGGNIGEWSLSEFLGTALGLAVFFGAAFWIGYAHPRLWFCGALVTWTTTLHAVTNIKNLRPPLDQPSGVTFHPIDMPRSWPSSLSRSVPPSAAHSSVKPGDSQRGRNTSFAQDARPARVHGMWLRPRPDSRMLMRESVACR